MQQGPPPEFWAGFFICFGIFFAIALLIQILFLLTLYRTQSEVAERNREIAPGTIWWTILLNLLPIVGSLWVIYVVNKLSNSLRREFENRGWGTTENFARTVGLVWGWGGLASTLISLVQYGAQFGGMAEVAMVISILNLPVGLTILVCWIIYWVLMYQYGKRLREDKYRYEPGSPEEDYDDAVGRPGRDSLEDDGGRARRGQDESGDDEDGRPRRRDRDEY